jgi:hypothetical protein
VPHALLLAVVAHFKPPQFCSAIVLKAPSERATTHRATMAPTMMP